MAGMLGGRIRRLAPRLVEPGWVDAMAAVAITGLAQYELRGTDASVGQALAVLVQTVPIAWRRTAPFPAVVVSAVALAVEGLLLTPTSTLGALIAGLVLTYSAARYVPASRVVVAAVAIAGGVGVHRAAMPGSGPVDVLFDLFFLAAAWGVGQGLRRRQAQTEQLVAERDFVIEQAAQRTGEAIARERGRIARELHDVVAHCLSIIAVQAGAAEQVVETDPVKARQAMLAVREQSQQAMVEMRRLVGLMRTTPADDNPADPPQPRLGQLDTLIGQLRDAGLAVTLERTGRVRALPHGVELCAFRIVQEALTNVVKHAGPVTTTVRLDYGPDQLHIIVADTGARGAEEPGIGHGLLGMRERVAIYGGMITAGPDPDGGFVLDARLPCPAGTVAGATTPTPP